MAGGELERIVIKVPAETRRALKARAARLGITFAAYVVRLAREDGVEVGESGEEGDLP
jgi:predicted DNA-binding protein